MSPPRQRPFTARLAILLAAAWVAAGALFKFFAGSPNDLPPTVQEFPLLKPAWTFRLAIGIELCVVITALLRPRIGWILLVLLFGFFDFLLWQMIQAGEESCGCFGSNVPIEPWQMMAIDTALLLGLLVGRAWRGLSKRPLKPALLVSLFLLYAIVLAAPWFQFREAEVVEVVREDGAVETQVQGDWRQFVPSSWEGRMIHDTDLASYFDPPEAVDLIPPPAHVILYRLSCEHCRDHFIELQADPIADRPLVLVRIPEPDDPSDVVSAVKPPAAVEIDLVELPRGYGITTPVTFDVDDLFMISNVVAQRAEDPE